MVFYFVFLFITLFLHPHPPPSQPITIEFHLYGISKVDLILSHTLISSYLIGRQTESQVDRWADRHKVVRPIDTQNAMRLVSSVLESCGVGLNQTLTLGYIKYQSSYQYLQCSSHCMQANCDVYYNIIRDCRVFILSGFRFPSK